MDAALYDAVYVPDGTNSVATLVAELDAIHFLNEAYKHCKAIAADEAAKAGIGWSVFCQKDLEEERPGNDGSRGYYCQQRFEDTDRPVYTTHRTA